jgi:hypothetical protein
MNTSWKTESGRLACRWGEVGDYDSYTWMEEPSAAQGSYLEPVPDFADHSPFGGPAWFEPQSTRRVPR